MKKYAELLENIAVFALLAEGGKTYGPYRRKIDSRWIILIQDDKGKMHTKSYPKHLMEQHLGYEIGDLTVDHWDSNVDNNALDNLKVIDRAEHSKQDTRRVRNIKLKCKMCGKDFERSPRLLRDKSRKGMSGPFCTRQCSGRYTREVQLGRREKLPVQDYVPSEYYKQKYEPEKQAFSDYIFEKYAGLSAKTFAQRLHKALLATLKDYPAFEGGVIDSIHEAKENDETIYEILIAAHKDPSKKGPWGWAGENTYAILTVFPELDVRISPDADFPPELLHGIAQAQLAAAPF